MNEPIDIIMGALVGGAIGWILAQLVLIFFEDEVFELFNRIVISVRSFFHLP